MTSATSSPSFFHAPRVLDRQTKELVGAVNAIVWSSPDASCVIAKLHTGETVKGPAEDEEIEEGVTYRFLGRWEAHHKHGDQFAFQTFVKDAPHNRAGVIKYLIDSVGGVGRAKAEKLWELFGSEAVAVLRTDPDRVVSAGVLTADQAAEAARDLTATAALEKTKIDLFGLFVGRGFPRNLLSACIERWGAKASVTVRRNPFILLTEDLPGAGFKRCDRLYLDLGFSRSRLKRQTLCAWNALHQDSTGHTWFRKGFAEEAVSRSCGGLQADPIAALVLGKRGGWIAVKREPGKDNPNRGKDLIWVAEAEKAEAEKRLAAAILALHAPCATSWPEIPTDAKLSDHQIDRATAATRRPVGILTGSPGCGKTYTAAAIIKAIVAKHRAYSVAVVAPTGKAAVRITAAMNNYGITLEASTIHRLLEVGRNGHDQRGWGFQRNRDNPLDQRFLIVDEWSMGDTQLAASLFEACAPGTHVLLVGDSGQLPPVGHGAPLRDMLAAGLAQGELTEIHRHAGMIVEACVAIRAGKPFKYVTKYDDLDLRSDKDGGTGKNFLHIETTTADESIDALRVLLQRWKRTGEFDPMWDVQPLTAMNKKSEVSRIPLNRMLQAELNPEKEDGEADGGGKNPFRRGDKIICLKNGMMELATSFGANDDPDAINQISGDSYVANGEIGAVLAVEPRMTYARFTCPDRTIKIPMGAIAPADDAKESDTEPKGTGCDFALAYAVTGHKMQGSQAPVAIVMIDKEAAMVASREWHYTLISRAEKLTVTIGSMATMLRQCRKVSLTNRKTFLKELLQQG